MVYFSDSWRSPKPWSVIIDYETRVNLRSLLVISFWTTLECVSRQVRESRLKLEHAVCWTQLSPSLGGVWGHSTAPPPCSSVAEVDATSLLCVALPLFSGKWRPLWWLPQGLSRASCRLPPSHPSSHCFDCLLHNGEFLCMFSSWAFFSEDRNWDLHLAEPCTSFLAPPKDVSLSFTFPSARSAEGHSLVFRNWSCARSRHQHFYGVFYFLV